MKWFKRKQTNNSVEEVFTVPKDDRRILSYVPDPENIRTGGDRRGSFDLSVEPEDQEQLDKLRKLGIRYVADFEVEVFRRGKRRKNVIKARAVDVSSTGMLIEVNPVDQYKLIEGAQVEMRFNIPPGTMPEGYEHSVKINATVVRTFTVGEKWDKKCRIGLQLEKPLPEYFKRKRWGYSIVTASMMLLFVTAFVVILRAESLIYFKFNWVIYLYSMIAAAFLISRYLYGSLYREVPVNPSYTPGVSIIIPCFNEEDWIQRTIMSCMNQDYPLEKLEVIVVDDYSTDHSAQKIEEIVERIYGVEERYRTKERLTFVKMPKNGGKREALIEGVKLAKHDLVVFVDSDSFLQPTAIRHLVQPFQDPKMGGVAGRTEVENKYTNVYTKMQTVRYYISFRIMKAAESYFDSVTCLSGPLSCYRKELVEKHADKWLNQKFLGHPATFGDDRSMTNFVLRTHRTSYQDSAACSTIVPSERNVFLKQQMRWKRSWLRESLRAGSFIWRKEPFMAFFFLIGFIVPIAAPIVVLYNLVYIPLTDDLIPITFLFGLLLMAMMMSLTHLFFKHSKLWFYGVVFCVFYEAVLLWQMPIAWVTFYKSTWGTRDTPEDVAARKKKQARKKRRSKQASRKTGQYLDM